MMQHDIIQALLDYIWVPILTFLITLWGKLNGLSTRAELLEQANQHQEMLRREDNERAENRRVEMLEKVDRHHSIVITKLDSLETRIKNGH